MADETKETKEVLEEDVTIEKEPKKDSKKKAEKKNAQQEKYDTLYNQFIRLQADFDNYKKRNASLATSMYNDGVNDAIAAILPTIDSIDMAINAQKDEEHKKGLELVKKAFMDALKKFDVEEIDAQGDFNPNLHEAVMSKDDPDNAGKIVQVLRAGYKRGDKVLRHTMCVVGQ